MLDDTFFVIAILVGCFLLLISWFLAALAMTIVESWNDPRAPYLVRKLRGLCRRARNQWQLYRFARDRRRAEKTRRLRETFPHWLG